MLSIILFLQYQQLVNDEFSILYHRFINFSTVFRHHFRTLTFSFRFASAALYFVEGLLIIIFNNHEAGAKVLHAAAFWPLIIMVILVGGLWAVEQYVPETFDLGLSGEGNANEAPRATAPKAKQAISESERVELLTKYNDLLAQGIITQEEFDAKKKELLGL